MNKKFLLVGLVLMSFGLLFWSCTKNSETPQVQPASLLFNPDQASFTGIPGNVWTFQVSASAPSGFISLTVDKTVDTGTPVNLKTWTTAPANVLVDTFSYTLDTAEIGKTVVLTFKLSETGTDGVTKTKSVITNAPPSPTARSYTAILLYAPAADKSAKSFFSTSTGATYSPDSVNASADPLSADLDFGYYFGASDSASLASPYGYSQLSDPTLSGQVAGWNQLNDISLKSTNLTQSNFTELSTYADIDTAYNAGSDEGDVITKLKIGQVIAFATDPAKTGGSKKGLILVSDIHGIYNPGDYIKLEILVQEPAQ